MDSIANEGSHTKIIEHIASTITEDNTESSELPRAEEETITVEHRSTTSKKVEQKKLL